MSLHWKVLLWMAAGAVLGVLMQVFLAAPSYAGFEVAAERGGVRVTSVALDGPAARGNIAPDDVFEAAVLHRGAPDQELLELQGPDDLSGAIARAENGEVVWLVPAGNAARASADDDLDALDAARAVSVTFDPGSRRATAIAPFAFVADSFLALLKMLIVPIVLTSIVTGVASVGSMGDLRRLGL